MTEKAMVCSPWTSCLFLSRRVFDIKYSFIKKFLTLGFITTDCNWSNYKLMIRVIQWNYIIKFDNNGNPFKVMTKP